MRGKACDKRKFRHGIRITPAYAGKSVRGDPRCHLSGDHPRLCGEKKERCQPHNLLWGSPPPMRGKVGVKGNKCFEDRITPAYAGKRFIVAYASNSNTGSPPPMRGKVHGHFCDRAICRITPAYAGKSPVPVHLDAAIQDHPRLCGEKRRCQLAMLVSTGSPPPMRGKVIEHIRQVCGTRITPAYAGKSGAGTQLLKRK